MRLDSDWEGVLHERRRNWEAEVHQRHLRAQLPRRPARWRRWAGAWLMGTGRRLTHWGAAMAEAEAAPPMSLAN